MVGAPMAGGPSTPALESEAARLGADLGEPRWDDDRWQAKIDLLLDLQPDAVSFTFGCPDAQVLRGLVNRFMTEHADAPPGYPHLHHLTAPLRAAAVAAGCAAIGAP